MPNSGEEIIEHDSNVISATLWLKETLHASEEV